MIIAMAIQCKVIEAMKRIEPSFHVADPTKLVFQGEAVTKQTLQ